MITSNSRRRTWSPWLIGLFCFLLSYARLSYAHGDLVTTLMVLTIWAIIPIAVISLIIIPLSLFIGKRLRKSKRISLVVGITGVIITYVSVIQYMISING